MNVSNYKPKYFPHLDNEKIDAILNEYDNKNSFIDDSALNNI
jgi:hypothetical protein